MIDNTIPSVMYNKWEKTGLYQNLSSCVKAKEDGKIYWDDNCYLPIAAAMESLKYHGTPLTEASAVASELIACWLWGKDKTIYNFDNDLAAMLAEQAPSSMEDTIPSEILLHLPHHCQFIQTNVIDGFSGFFIFIEYDLDRHECELRFNLVRREDNKSIPMMLHILPNKTTGECIAAAYGEQNVNTISENTAICLQLLLYILSADADVRRSPITSAARAKSKKESKRQSNIMNVGVSIGRSIRMSYGETSNNDAPRKGHTGSYSSKRPHARRGHWHHYWSGASDNRNLILRWTAPTFIHSGGNMNTTIIPVKKPRKTK